MYLWPVGVSPLGCLHTVFIDLFVFTFQVELQEAANEAGYDMRLVAMETLSLREQALQITCSKVLIGVQGILPDISG